VANEDFRWEKIAKLINKVGVSGKEWENISIFALTSIKT
jgi:hypothetical protein